MKPQRIQLSRKKGWKMPPNTVKVDRTTPWGNPFVVGKHGTRIECVGSFSIMTLGHRTADHGDQCLKDQHAWFNHANEHMSELRGKNLACWCKAGEPCHADVLLEIANR